MRLTGVLVAVVCSAAAASCTAEAAPDRCMTVDNSKGSKTGPPFRICIPDKAQFGPMNPDRNAVRIVNQYDGNWLPAGAYEVAVVPPGLADWDKTTVAQRQQEHINLTSKREIISNGTKLYYKERSYPLGWLPEEARAKAVGVGFAEIRKTGDISIDAALAKPSDYEKDPVGSMDRLIGKSFGELTKRITILQ